MARMHYKDIYFDTHCHTEFSFDSNMSIEGAMAKAASLGIGLVTTEHVDLNNMDVGGFEINFDIDSYFREYAGKRGETLLLGIETGIDMENIEKNRWMVEDHPFDMVIGSMHSMRRLDVSRPSDFREMTAAEFYRDYLNEAAKTVAANPFIDTLAHLDYPSRYLRLSPRNVRYQDAVAEFDELFDVLVSNDITLELNLRRPLQGDVLESLRSILEGYRSCGGRFVTLGSDAHNTDQIGANFREGLVLLKETGLAPCTYQERTRILNPGW